MPYGMTFWRVLFWVLPEPMHSQWEKGHPQIRYTTSTRKQLRTHIQATPVFRAHTRMRLLAGSGRQLLVYDTTHPSGPAKVIPVSDSSIGEITHVACIPFHETLVSVSLCHRCRVYFAGWFRERKVIHCHFTNSSCWIFFSDVCWTDKDCPCSYPCNARKRVQLCM